LDLIANKNHNGYERKFTLDLYLGQNLRATGKRKLKDVLRSQKDFKIDFKIPEKF
jgi:hypothetical protein